MQNKTDPAGEVLELLAGSMMAKCQQELCQRQQAGKKRGWWWEHPLIAYSSVLSFFETPKSILFSYLHWQPLPHQKKFWSTLDSAVLPHQMLEAGSGSLCQLQIIIPPGRNAACHLQEHLLYIMGLSPSFLLLFPSIHNAHFLPPTFRANAQLRKITASSRRGWKGSGGTELQPQLPTQTSWKSTSWGPGLHLASSADYEPCTPKNIVPLSAVLGPAALISPGSLAEEQNLRPYASTADSESVCEHDSQVIHACTKV